MFEWRENGMGILHDTVSVIWWVSLWAISDAAIEFVTSNKLYRLLIYVAMAILTILTLLIFGSPYYEKATAK